MFYAEKKSPGIFVAGFNTVGLSQQLGTFCRAGEVQFESSQSVKAYINVGSCCKSRNSVQSY